VRTTIGALLIALEFLNPVAVAGGTEVPAALAAAVVRDQAVAQCALEEGVDGGAYVVRAFDLRNLRLRTGERMVVAVATDACLFLGQSTRLMIFERRDGAYRRVLNDVTLPDVARIGKDGTAVLPTHETMETIFEAAYVWNGSVYAFSPSRSAIYDVSLGSRRPYQIPVKFTPGTHEATISGGVALNFGDRYAFAARAGETLTIVLVRHAGRGPRIYLAHGDHEQIADLSAGSWSARLPNTGTYIVGVFGTGEPSATTITTYVLRLTIR
jgi:hypothetical protein